MPIWQYSIIALFLAEGIKCVYMCSNNLVAHAYSILTCTPSHPHSQNVVELTHLLIKYADYTYISTPNHHLSLQDWGIIFNKTWPDSNHSMPCYLLTLPGSINQSMHQQMIVKHCELSCKTSFHIHAVVFKCITMDPIHCQPASIIVLAGESFPGQFHIRILKTRELICNLKSLGDKHLV